MPISQALILSSFTLILAAMDSVDILAVSRAHLNTSGVMRAFIGIGVKKCLSQALRLFYL